MESDRKRLRACDPRCVPGALDFKSMNVLVVDGDRVAAQLLCGRLNHSGHRARVAFDAQHAVMACQRSRPHVIILDVQLPGDGGADLLARLKAMPQMAMVPIIVLTAAADRETAARALGADAFMLKPADLQLLDAEMQRCVPPTRVLSFPEPVDDVIVFRMEGTTALAPEVAIPLPQSSAVVRNILIVDDDPVISNLLAHRLKRDGFATLFAADVAHAIRHLNRFRVDAVILDLEMPDGNGLDVIQRVRSFDRTGDVRILVVSGTTDAHGAEFALAAGADHFFPKPPDIDGVIGALRECYPPSKVPKTQMPWLVSPMKRR